VANYFAPWLAEVRIFFRPSGDKGRSDFTLGELFGTLGRRWRTLVVFAAVGVVLALAFALITTPLYSASVMIGSVKANSDTDSNISASAISGILRATGGAQGLVADPRLQNYLLLLTSLQVSGRIEGEFHLLRRLRPTQWDSETGTWKRPSGVVFNIKEAIKHALFLAPWSPPDASTLADYLEDHVKETETKVSGIYRITVTNPDRELVGPLLAGLLRDANDIMRESDEAKAKEAETYLIQKLSSASVTSVDQREALAQLLITQEQKLLLAHLRGNYVAEAVDEISISKGPVWPPLIILLLAGASLGVILGAVLVLMRE